MLLNDPMLYGATLPYSEFPIPSHCSTLFTTPWQQPNPFYTKQWQVTPWQVNPWQVNPWASTPWQDVPNYIPPEFGISPYQQYQTLQPVPMLQQVPPITPWLQRPIPFPQPIPFAQPFGQPFTQPFGQPFTQPFVQPFGQAFGHPFAQPFGLNRPLFGWQRPPSF